MHERRRVSGMARGPARGWLRPIETAAVLDARPIVVTRDASSQMDSVAVLFGTFNQKRVDR